MKLAVVKLSALGDIIHAMVVLQYIKHNFPNIRIDWIVEERFIQVLENNPHIDNIYTVKLKNNKSGFVREFKKLKQISKNDYDLVIDLQGLIKSAIVSRLLCKNVMGFDKKSLREPMATFLYKKTFGIAYEKNVIERNVELISKALNLNAFEIKNKQPFLYSSVDIKFKPELLIIVGSSWESKVYPKDKFIKIIKALHVDTYISWGNENEKNDALYIANQSDAKMLPKLNLNTLKSVIKNTKLAIGADSGPTHMAWALNIPSITIFGPTPSERNTYKTNINLVVDCKKKIDAKALDKNDFCIKNIDEEEIIKLARKLLN